MSVKGPPSAAQRPPQAERTQDSTWGDEEHLWEGEVSRAPLPELSLEEVAPAVVEVKLDHRRVADQLAQSGLFELPLRSPSIPPGGFSAPPSEWRDEVSSLPVHASALSQRPASLKPRVGSFEASVPPQHDGWRGEEGGVSESSSREVTKPAGPIVAEQLERVKRYQEARQREQVSAQVSDHLSLTSHEMREAQHTAPQSLSRGALAQRSVEEEARLHAELKVKRLEEEARLKATRDELERLQARLARELALAEEARFKAEQEAALEAEREAALEAEREAALEAEREAAREAEREAALEAEREARLRAEREAALEAEREARLKAEREAAREAEREAAREAARLREERRRHEETLEMLLASFQREGFTESLKALWRERDQLERLERERLEREARDELEELLEAQSSWESEALQSHEQLTLALDSLPVNPLEGIELSLPPLASGLIQALMPYSEPINSLNLAPVAPQTLGEDDETLPPSPQPVVDELSERPVTSSASAHLDELGEREVCEKTPADVFHARRPEAKMSSAHTAPILGLREQRGARWERDERLGSRAERALFSAPGLLSKEPR